MFLFDSAMYHGHRFVKVYVFVSMFCFIFSYHFFDCLPWLFGPILKQCITFTFSRLLPILETCPNFAVLFCQPMSFPGVEYSVLSHFSSGRALSPATVSLTISSLPLWFFIHLSFSNTSILLLLQVINYYVTHSYC